MVFRNEILNKDKINNRFNDTVSKKNDFEGHGFHMDQTPAWELKVWLFVHLHVIRHTKSPKIQF